MTSFRKPVIARILMDLSVNSLSPISAEQVNRNTKPGLISLLNQVVSIVIVDRSGNMRLRTPC